MAAGFALYQRRMFGLMRNLVTGSKITLRNTSPDLNSTFRQEAQLMLTNPRDAFRG